MAAGAASVASVATPVINASAAEAPATSAFVVVDTVVATAATAGAAAPSTASEAACCTDALLSVAALVSPLPSPVLPLRALWALGLADALYRANLAGFVAEAAGTRDCSGGCLRILLPKARVPALFQGPVLLLQLTTPPLSLRRRHASVRRPDAAGAVKSRWRHGRLGPMASAATTTATTTRGASAYRCPCQMMSRSSR